MAPINIGEATIVHAILKTAVIKSLGDRDPLQKQQDDQVAMRQTRLEAVPPSPVASAGRKSNKQINKTPMPPKSLPLKAPVALMLADAFEAAEGLYHDTYLTPAKQKKPLEQAIARPQSLGISAHPAAQTSRARLALLNACVSIAKQSDYRMPKLGQDHAKIALESHLTSVDEALRHLNAWVLRDQAQAEQLGAQPANLRSLLGAVSQHRARVSDQLNQQMQIRLGQLGESFAYLQASGQQSTPAYRQAAQYLCAYMSMQENRWAREYAARSEGLPLRVAMGEIYAPAGWIHSAVDTSLSTSDATWAGSALLTALRWGTRSFNIEHPYEQLPKSTSLQHKLVEQWQVFEAHDGQARCFFGLHKQTKQWALLAYVPPGHVTAAADGNYTTTYNTRHIMPALSKLTAFYPP